MYQLPSHLHHIARFEERRLQIAELARIELLVARILTTVRRADVAMAVNSGWHNRAELAPEIAPIGPVVTLAQPSMAWVDGPRTQPRNGRGRFLSKLWLAEAELFLPADRAWFRSPLSTEVR